VPNNYIALTIFTVTFGIVVAAICGSCYNMFSNGGTLDKYLSKAILVVVSALLTFAVTLSLTLYACTTKTDFTMCGKDGYEI
jgi:hypothetical protein